MFSFAETSLSYFLKNGKSDLDKRKNKTANKLRIFSLSFMCMNSHYSLVLGEWWAGEGGWEVEEGANPDICQEVIFSTGPSGVRGA